MTEKKLVKMFTDYCEEELKQAQRCQVHKDKEGVNHCFTMAYGALMFLNSYFDVYNALRPVWDEYWDKFADLLRKF